MLFRIDPTIGVGLAEQIAGQVRGALLSAQIRPGDRLPPARQLAAGLDVNMHTVLRGYSLLREEGLIELRPGRGAQVRTDIDIAAMGLDQQILALVQSAGRLGIGREELITKIRKVTP